MFFKSCGQYAIETYRSCQSLEKYPGIFCFQGHNLMLLNWLRRLVDVMRLLDSRAVLSPMIPSLDPTTWRVQRGPRVLTRMQNTFHVEWWRSVNGSRWFYEVSALRGVAKLMTREVYEAIGGFDDSMNYGGEEFVPGRHFQLNRK